MSHAEEELSHLHRQELAEIHAKLARLDEAIRGNGKPGINARLDRLEASERTRSRLLWIIAGAVVSLAVSALWKLVVIGG